MAEDDAIQTGETTKVKMSKSKKLLIILIIICILLAAIKPAINLYNYKCGIDCFIEGNYADSSKYFGKNFSSSYRFGESKTYTYFEHEFLDSGSLWRFALAADDFYTETDKDIYPEILSCEYDDRMPDKSFSYMSEKHREQFRQVYDDLLEKAEKQWHDSLKAQSERNAAYYAANTTTHYSTSRNTTTEPSLYDDDWYTTEKEYTADYNYTTTKEYKNETTGQTDPYSAADYAAPEDFYDDYRDDFFDYDEAEDYWYENN